MRFKSEFNDLEFSSLNEQGESRGEWFVWARGVCPFCNYKGKFRTRNPAKADLTAHVNKVHLPVFLKEETK